MNCLKVQIPSTIRRQRSRAFAMLEVILAMTLFAVAVVALGRATMSAIEAETVISESDIVRDAVAAQAERVLAATIAPQDEKIELEDAYAGIVLTQKVTAFTPEDSEQNTTGPLFRVELEGSRGDALEGAHYRLVFYVRR